MSTQVLPNKTIALNSDDITVLHNIYERHCNSIYSGFNQRLPILYFKWQTYNVLLGVALIGWYHGSRLMFGLASFNGVTQLVDIRYTAQTITFKTL